MELDGVRLALPEKFTELRPHQVDAIQEIRQLFAAGRKVIFLDAPTGAGKTLIGEVTRQMLDHDYDEVKRALYLCTTLSLQDQFMHDFPYAKLIKGRSNYPTKDDPERFRAWGARRLTAGDCTRNYKGPDSFPACGTCDLFGPDYNFDPESRENQSKGFLHCTHCHPWQECPYEVAKREALASKLTVANLAYLLTEANNVGRFGRKWPSDLLPDPQPAFQAAIIDEGDMMESVLMSQVELSINAKTIKKLNLPLPQKKTVASSWVEWCEAAGQTLKNEMSWLNASAAQYGEDDVPKDLRESIKEVSQLFQKVGQVHTAITNQPDNWVLADHGSGGVTLKPVEVSAYGQSKLWRHSDRFLVMSATLISPFQMADDLGLADHEWDAVRVSSNFPIERRPVRVRPVASVTRKTYDEAVPRMVKAVSQILDDHPQDRILVHTVSYALTRDLKDGLTSHGHGHRIQTYDSSRGREDALAAYRRSHASVLLAPSFDRGIDLPDDECRVIVIAKMPFPNLGDEQVKKRLYGTKSGKSWFATQTVRSLVQMTGRGMRHHNDFVTTYILDSQFHSNVWRNAISRNLIPEWWREAIVMEGPK